MNEIKVDWLSFTYQPSDDDKAAYNNIVDCFLEKFPNFKNIMDECIVLVSGNGKYYSNCLGWNDGIMFSYDDAKAKSNYNIGTGEFIDEFEHGFNVSIPAHGLHYLSDLLGFDVVEDNFLSFKPVIQYLFDNDCRITRLDICFDDMQKVFTPYDFNDFMRNTQIKSPCRKWQFFGGGKNGGSTFYIGSRANKYLRIYDKNAESSGVINAIRYEIEVHHKYAKQLCETVLNDTFDFSWFLEKWFIQLKEKSSCESLDKKDRLSMLPTLPEWESFIKSSFANNKEVVIPLEKKAVNFEKTQYWIDHQVLKSLLIYITVNGVDSLLDKISDVTLENKHIQVINDAIRIYNTQSKEKNISKYEMLKNISQNFESWSWLDYWAQEYKFAPVN